MRGYLLDTHAALWWWTGIDRLGPAARAVLETAEAPIYVSCVSAFEIGQKWRLGKLAELDDPEINYPRLMAINGFEELSLTTDQAGHAGIMVGDHRDPFDRFIAAQALAEDLIVVTRDPALAAFGCKTLW